MDVSPVGAGTIQLNQTTLASYPSNSTFGSGESVRLEAVPTPGYHFDSWSGDLPGTTNPTTIAMTCPKKIIANFSKITHTVPGTSFRLTVEVSPVGAGTIQLNQTNPASYPTNSTFDSGESVRLEALPTPGYHFDSWSGDLSGTTNPTTITMTVDKKITAKFSKIMHTLTIGINGNGSTSPTDGVYSYAEGTIVDITATPDRGWLFDSWTGYVANPDAATSRVTIDADKNLVANFSQKVYLLTIQVNGSGSTNPAVGTHEYIEGTLVDITCNPNEGWRFVNWVGDVVSPELATTIMTMDSDKILVGNFHKPGFNWWLIGGIVAGILIIVSTIWLVFRARAS